MTFADLLDLGHLVARTAEPDVHVGILHADLLGEIGHFHSGVSGRLECGEDLLFNGSARSALGGACDSLLGSLGHFGAFFAGRPRRFPVVRTAFPLRRDASCDSIFSISFTRASLRSVSLMRLRNALELMFNRFITTFVIL